MYVGKCGNGDPISPSITEASCSASGRSEGLREAGHGAAGLCWDVPDDPVPLLSPFSHPE